MGVSKTGIWKDTSNSSTLVLNDFCITNTLDDWTNVSGTVTNNILTLTGQSPQLTSVSFKVNPNDILVVEFDLAFTVLSDGSGIYLGSDPSSNTNRINYSTSQKAWTTVESNSSTSWNTYWLLGYNSTTRKKVKSYLVGENVDKSMLPAPEGTTVAIQLTNGKTTAKIRTGYNANTGMTIEIYDFKVYSLTGFVENDDNPKILEYSDYAQNFIEI